MKRSTFSLSFIVTIIVIVLGIMAVKFLFPKGDNARYITATVDRGDIEQVVSASGTLNPVKLVNVGTQISGVVLAIHVDFNDTVEKGQILAELDQSLLKTQQQQTAANLASANASLDLALSNFKRFQALYSKNYIARADLDKARQEMEAAQAQVKTVSSQIERDKVNLSYTVIRSPVAGVIISRDVDIGQTVAASFQTPTLFKIAQDLKKMQIDTSLSEADVGSVKEGMPVRFTVDAFPGRHFSGKVRQIRLNSTTVQNVVTYNVVIDVENPDLVLLPGMTAFVTIIEAEHENVLRMPNSALSYKPTPAKSSDRQYTRPKNETKDDNTQSIYALKDGEPVRLHVRTGITTGKLTEILEGELHEGDTVITDDIQAERKTGGNKSAARTPRLF